jgi:hypothetical protein
MLARIHGITYFVSNDNLTGGGGCPVKRRSRFNPASPVGAPGRQGYVIQKFAYQP